MSSPAMKNLFAADDLTHAVIATGPDGACVLPIQCLRVVDGVLVLPWPVPQPGNNVVELHCDKWLITHPAATTLPMWCSNQNAARTAGQAFADAVARGSVNADDPPQVADWCAWWCKTHSDATGLRWRPVR
jgi:hypothetical protein